ncbi:MAG: uncharacterized protein KVP18_001942 [Porospora cf. gigantea A]|nr:MAG: hypothetical protein KVP18_001942 [Porospora cf. gigantea A]
MRFPKDRRIRMSDEAIINVRYRLQNPPEGDWDSLHVLVRRLENLKTVDPPQEAQRVALSLRIEREPKQFCEIPHDAWNADSMELNDQVTFDYEDQMNLRIRLESDGLAVGHACIDLWASTSNAVQNVNEEKVPLRTWAGEPLGWLYVALKFLKNMSVGTLELSEFDVDVEAVCYRFQNDNAELSDIRPHLRKVILKLDKLLKERQNMPDEDSDSIQLHRMDNEAQILQLVEFGKRLAASRRVRYVKRDSPWPDPIYRKTLRYYPPKPYCVCDEFCNVKKQLTSTDRTDEYETIRQELLRRCGRSKINKNSNVI